MKLLRDLLKGFDLFSTNVSLRFEDSATFETATGGFFSIALVVLFVIVFMGTLSNTLNRNSISATTTNIQEADPTHTQLNTSKFMFALGINDVNIIEGERWFDIYMQFRKYKASEGTRDRYMVPLKRCQR